MFLRHDGSVPADHLELGFDVEEYEASGSSGSDESDTAPGSAEGMSKQIEIAVFTYDGTNVESLLTDANGNGIVDFDDLTRSGNAGALDDLSPPSPGEMESMSMTFEFADDSRLSDGSSNNDYQGDEVTFDITFALHQSESQDL